DDEEAAIEIAFVHAADIDLHEIAVVAVPVAEAPALPREMHRRVEMGIEREHALVQRFGVRRKGGREQERGQDTLHHDLHSITTPPPHHRDPIAQGCRSTMPARAPVWRSPSIVTTPLTMTVPIPVGSAVGFSQLATSSSRSRSKTTISARSPSRIRPR